MVSYVTRENLYNLSETQLSHLQNEAHDTGGTMLWQDVIIYVMYLEDCYVVDTHRMLFFVIVTTINNSSKTYYLIVLLLIPMFSPYQLLITGYLLNNVI